MEIVDKRAKKAAQEAAVQYDDFKPTLAGFVPVNDAVLLRELKLPEEGMITMPDVFKEQCLYCEVIAIADAVERIAMNQGSIARILKGIGTTIEFSDTEQGQRYFTVNYQDIIGVWS